MAHDSVPSPVPASTKLLGRQYLVTASGRTGEVSIHLTGGRRAVAGILPADVWDAVRAGRKTFTEAELHQLWWACFERARRAAKRILKERS